MAGACAKTLLELHYPNVDTLVFKCCFVVTDVNTSNGLFILLINDVVPYYSF